jgi:hypothetical protein
MPHPAWVDAAEAVELDVAWAAAGNRASALKAHWPISKSGWMRSNEDNHEQGPKEPPPGVPAATRLQEPEEKKP